MNDVPHVSVLVVSYRQEAYIQACLESVLGQEFPAFEVVLCDDASPDATVAVARKLEGRWPHPLRILTAPVNGGITKNINRGLRACRGRYVAFLGGDDLAFPGKLAAQAALLDARPEVALCYHDMEVFSDDGSVPRHLRSSTHPPREGTARDLVRHGNFILGSDVMVRREALPDQLPESIPWASDWLMNIEASRHGSIAYIPRPLGGYRRHAGSVIQRGLARKDPILTMDIVEARYPDLARDARRRRGELEFHAAQRALRAGAVAEVAPMARKALMDRMLWEPRRLAWLVAASLGLLRQQRDARRGR